MGRPAMLDEHHAITEEIVVTLERCLFDSPGDRPFSVWLVSSRDDVFRATAELSGESARPMERTRSATVARNVVKMEKPETTRAAMPSAPKTRPLASCPWFIASTPKTAGETTSDDPSPPAAESGASTHRTCCG